MRVVVANGEIASVSYADDGTDVQGTNDHNVKTIDATFDQAETSISGGDVVRVEFDPVLSYPTLLGVSSHSAVPDYGFTIQISDLQASP